MTDKGIGPDQGSGLSTCASIHNVKSRIGLRKLSYASSERKQSTLVAVKSLLDLTGCS